MQTPIVPPTPPSGGAPATSLPSGAGTAPALPPSLAQALTNGGALTAQVTARPQPGTLTLSVGGQSVQVQTPLPLPLGTTLTASLQAPGPPATLFLQPQAQSGGAAGQSATPAIPGAGQAAAASAGLSNTPSVVTTLTQGSVLSATVTAPAATGQAGAPTTAAPASTAATGQVTQGLATGPAPAAANAPTAAALPPGTAVQVRVLALAPSAQTLPQPPVTASSAGIFSGVVTGQTASGGVSVQTPIGTLNLSTPTPPTTGTQLLLQMVGEPRPPLPGSGVAHGSGARFEALRDAVSLLRGGDPAAAQRLTQGLLPQPNAQFGLAAAFLANAVRQGRFESWGGSETLRALDKAGGAGLKARLDGDMTQAQARVTDSSGQDWRVMTLPFLNQEKIEEIRLYMRDRQDAEDGKGDGDAPRPKRFIIEADFSRLGPIQLDGLSREKHVDVAVRSHRPLDEAAQREIEALFADTVTAMGLTGRVDFRVVQAFDPPPPDPRPTQEGGLTV
jgi:hypothetical protein